MKNLKKLSRNSLKEVTGGKRRCEDGCGPNECCLTAGYCGQPNGTALCQGPDSNGCQAGTYMCNGVCISGNQPCYNF